MWKIIKGDILSETTSWKMLPQSDQLNALGPDFAGVSHEQPDISLAMGGKISYYKSIQMNGCPCYTRKPKQSGYPFWLIEVGWGDLTLWRPYTLMYSILLILKALSGKSLLTQQGLQDHRTWAARTKWLSILAHRGGAQMRDLPWWCPYALMWIMNQV